MILRWFLGCSAALVGVAWIGLAVLGNNFRQSFGASPVDALQVVALPLVLSLILVSVLLPSQRWLLHLTAVACALGVVGCVFVLRESAFIGVVGLAYLALWFLFYWRTPLNPAI